MKYSLARDKKQRGLFYRIEKKKKILTALLKNKFIVTKVRIEAKRIRSILKGYRSIIKNYCLFSGRARSVIRNYNISRMFFKKFVNFGYIKGVKKASW